MHNCISRTAGGKARKIVLALSLCSCQVMEGPHPVPGSQGDHDTQPPFLDFLDFGSGRCRLRVAAAQGPWTVTRGTWWLLSLAPLSLSSVVFGGQLHPTVFPAAVCAMSRGPCGFSHGPTGISRIAGGGGGGHRGGMSEPVGTSGCGGEVGGLFAQWVGVEGGGFKENVRGGKPSRPPLTTGGKYCSWV